MAAKIRKGDKVVVITGSDRGKTGEVLRVLRSEMRVLVQGVNMIKRHTRPNPNKGIQGGILEREAPIQISNLKVVCPECGKPSRLGRRRLVGLAAPVITSAEKWQRQGWYRRSLRNLFCLALYFAGMPPRLIARLYG